MAAKAPVALGPEEIVDEAEQTEAEAREQHERAGDVAAGLVAEAERPQRPAPRLDPEHRDHDEQPGRGRQRAVAEVPALQRRRVEQVAAARSPAGGR